MYEKCRICGHYPSLPNYRHICPPRWYVVVEWDTGGEGKEIYADTAEDAAVRWAEGWFDGTEQGLNWEVYVYNATTLEGKLLSVEGEVAIHFNARIQEDAESIPVHPFFESEE